MSNAASKFFIAQRSGGIQAYRVRPRARGFSLIELMVSITLGILIGIGLVSLFAATSKTNHVQELMAEMQENGRYAVTRLNYDLRLSSRQMLNASGLSDPAQPNTTLDLAPNVYVATIPFPDAAVAPPTGWPVLSATNPSWPLSPANFIQGYACTGGACSPTTVPAYIPATGTGNLNRVPNTDVLSMRYLNGQGWSNSMGEIIVGCGTDGNLIAVTLNPVVQTSGTYTYTSPAFNFVAGQLALLADSSGNSAIFQVNVTAGPPIALTPAIVNGAGSGKVHCVNSGDVKLYNFSRDFVTVTYWLRVNDDPNVAGREIPSLIRTVADNTGAPGAGAVHTDLELVQGVEQMNFIYGFQQGSGNIQNLTANLVAAQSTKANCPPPPGQFTHTAPVGGPPVIVYESNCLWRALASVETHILVNSVNNLFSLTPPERAYQYMLAPGTPYLNPVPSPGKMPNGLDAGAMMRREFITLVSVRNYNS